MPTTPRSQQISLSDTPYYHCIYSQLYGLLDLNPIRADICKTLEISEHTSIKQRIEQITQTKMSNRTHNTTVVKLSSFIGSSLKKEGIAFDLKDYLGLADWTGRDNFAKPCRYAPAWHSLFYLN